MRTLLLALLSFAVLITPADGRSVASVEVPETATVAAELPRLVLNGAGVRKKFFVKVYVGALYLERPATTVAEVLRQEGPKRVAMHVLYGEISRENLIGGWEDGFANNQDPARMGQLRERLDAFNGLFDTVREGDLIWLDFIPGEGTRVTIRGQMRGTVPGKDFNDALLQVWLGERPADKGLKRSMLGQD